MAGDGEGVRGGERATWPSACLPRSRPPKRRAGTSAAGSRPRSSWSRASRAAGRGGTGSSTCASRTIPTRSSSCGAWSGLQRAYNLMNEGDLAVEKKDDAAALKAYSAAEALVPDNAEMAYWHAVALVNMGRVDESLPIFAKAFRLHPKWRDLTPRLPKAGLLPDDPKLIARIVAAKE